MSVVHRIDSCPTPGRRRARRRARPPLPPVRLRGLRALDRPRLLLAPPEPARPGVRVRHRPRPRWRRAGPPLVRGRQAASQAPYLQRLRRLRRPARRTRLHGAPAHSPAGEPRRAVCSWGRWPTGPPSCSERWSPRCPSSTALTTMLDDSLPLTVIEWEEWGNPGADPEVYAAMKAYSPYDNVRGADADGRPRAIPTSSPPTGLEDPRVGYWEPAKWVAQSAGRQPGRPGAPPSRARSGPRRALGPLRRLAGRGLRPRLRPRRAGPGGIVRRGGDELAAPAQAVGWSVMLKGVRNPAG